MLTGSFPPLTAVFTGRIKFAPQTYSPKILSASFIFKRLFSQYTAISILHSPFLKLSGRTKYQFWRMLNWYAIAYIQSVMFAKANPSVNEATLFGCRSYTFHTYHNSFLSIKHELFYRASPNNEIFRGFLYILYTILGKSTISPQTYRIDRGNSQKEINF